MDRATEERWRTALKQKGVETVQVELDMLPGSPTDVCYDVGDEPPYPTRAFLEAWCRGKPPKPFGLSGTSSMVVIMCVLIVVCIIRGLSSWSPSEKNWLSDGAVRYSHESIPIKPGGFQHADNAIANADVITTADPHTTLPGCSAVSSANDMRTVQTLTPCAKHAGHATEHK